MKIPSLLIALLIGWESAAAEPWRPTELPRPNADGFVLIRAGSFLAGDVVTRREPVLLHIEDFEMAAAPVTNADYKTFVDATGAAAPLHWPKGRIPAGQERWPVVYVNRYDVDAYVAWRTKRDGRSYRLPTDAEFEYAARGGLVRKRYPWGDDDPTERANYDPGGARLFDAWRKYVRPVASYAPNGYGLHDMAGNVWQMVLTQPEPGRVRFKFRIRTPSDLEGRIVGGSWARNATYLRCGYGGGASPGIRHPDIGFRLVREPRTGAPNFNMEPRRVVVVPQSTGRVFVSWQLLTQDGPGTAFNVYRSSRRDEAGVRVNRSPVTGGTQFVDDLKSGGVPLDTIPAILNYRVRSVDASGREGFSSEWVGVEPSGAPNGVAAAFKPLPRSGGMLPVFGDLNGDGLLDAVIRFDNGNVEMSRDPGVPIEIEAFLGDGRFLWRRPLVRHEHAFGSASDVPVNVYDLDGDGKAEVIARYQEGEEVFVAVLDGLTGRVLRKTRWPPMLTDFAKSSTRIHLAIAYLDGRNPAIVTQTGLYENEVFVAFDRDLKQLWEFRSLAETNGSGSHHIDVADVDADGRDEIFDGTTCLNPDGTVRWSIYREHPDIVAIRDFLPERPGLEVFYAVESSVHAGAYMVDARTGTIIWKINREDDPRWTHAHVGWTADIFAGSPGPEAFTNRDGHLAKDTVLLSASGKLLLEPFPPGQMPIEWDGDATRELIAQNASSIGEFDGKAIVLLSGSITARGRVVMVADLVGDFRDEVVLVGPDEQGNLAVQVITATTPVASRAITRTADRHYRLWLARNLTGGYGAYFEAPVLEAGTSSSR